MAEVEVFDEEDEISLFDLWEKLRKGWRYVAAGTVVGLLGAGLAIGLIAPKYEAVGIVQVGKVGQVVPSGQMGQAVLASSPVEEPAPAVERMKSASFQIAVATSVGDQASISAIRTGGLANIISLQIPKAAAMLIEVRAKADSADAAKKIVVAAVAELSRRHAEIAEVAIGRLNAELELAREKLKRAEVEQTSLNQLINSAAVKDDRFTQLSLLTSLRVQKESEVFFQRQMVSMLEAALSPPNTQPAHTLEDVFASEKPVSPKKGLILVLGFLGGLLLGVMWVFVSDAWRVAAERRTSV